MPKSPLAIVTERFKDKDSLVAAVKALATDTLWVDRLNEDKGLAHVSNRKLLHLHELLTRVKQEHGSRSKLIDAILATDQRDKDKGYRARLEQRSTPTLFALYQLAKKRTATTKRAS